MRRGAAGRLLLLAVVLGGVVLHPSGAGAAPIGTAVNLKAGDAVRAALRTAYLRAHPGYAASEVEGPLAGSVFHARYTTRAGAVRWALATFSNPATQTTDQPEVFRRMPGGGWLDRGDTGGDLAKVPCPVLRVWGLDEQSDRC